MDESPTSIGEWIKLAGATGIGGLTMALFARFAFRKITEESTAAQRSAGESDIIEQMRREVDRLATLNDRLSNKVGELQDQVFALRNENAQLRQEINILKAASNAGR